MVGRGRGREIYRERERDGLQYLVMYPIFLFFFVFLQKGLACLSVTGS